jgi:hypothetical protein
MPKGRLCAKSIDARLTHNRIEGCLKIKYTSGVTSIPGIIWYKTFREKAGITYLPLCLKGLSKKKTEEGT